MPSSSTFCKPFVLGVMAVCLTIPPASAQPVPVGTELGTMHVSDLRPNEGEPIRYALSIQDPAAGASIPPRPAESKSDGGDPAAQPAELPDWLQSLRVGYDNAFVIASLKEGSLSVDDYAYQLRINGWGQFRYLNFHSHNEIPDQSEFQLPRARLVLSGSALTRELEYFIQLDGRSSSGDVVRLLDYYLQLDIGEQLWGLADEQLGVKAGRYKLPFSFARQQSGRDLQFTDRSMASIYFDVNRSIGIGAFGKFHGLPAPFYWEAALGNGLVTGGAETGSSGSLDDNLAITMRIHGFPIGEWGAPGLADLDYHTSPSVRIGAGFANSTINRLGSTEYGEARVVDSGLTLASLLPADISAYTISMYSADCSLKYRGLSTTLEYYFRNINQFEGAPLADLFDHGFWLQAGYFLIPGDFEILGRWSRIVGNSGTLGGVDESSDELAAGFNRYFHGQNLKWTVDATHLNGAPISSTALNIFPGYDGWLFRSQVQISF